MKTHAEPVPSHSSRSVAQRAGGHSHHGNTAGGHAGAPLPEELLTAQKKSARLVSPHGEHVKQLQALAREAGRSRARPKG